MSPKLGDGLGNVLGTKVSLDSSPLDNEKYPPLKSPNYDKSVAFWSASRIKKKKWLWLKKNSPTMWLTFIYIVGLMFY